MMEEKTIETSSALAMKIGFTPDRFRSQSFLRLAGNRIVMSYVLPRGDFGRPELAAAIREAGYTPATIDLGTGRVEDLR